MYLISADKIFLCDDDFSILDNKAFVFDEKIIQIGDLQDLKIKFPQAKIINTPKNSLILPSFLNLHTHLEFSANSYTLEFGDFLKWVKSVIKSRDNLNKKAKDELISKIITKMKKSGTGLIGEISSFGSDLNSCANSDIRMIFFNEILGVDKALNEAKKQDFKTRFMKSLEFKNDLFIPAVSIHSSYSVNDELIKFGLDFAKKYDTLVSTHFLESNYENLWIKKGKGKFKEWFKNFNQKEPLHSDDKFLSYFKGQRTLFAHCVWVDDFSMFDENLHHISHCAFSNFLLSKKTLNLKKAFKHTKNIHIATDGLSSNISLSMLDEMRANLLIHKDFNMQEFAKMLILMATNKPAKAVNLKLGQIKQGYEADFSVFNIQECEDEQLPLQFILNAKEVDKIFIKGKECKL